MQDRVQEGDERLGGVRAATKNYAAFETYVHAIVKARRH